jgi:hypothetical protein
MYEVVSARPYLLLIIWLPPNLGSDIRQEYGQLLSCLAYAGSSNSPPSSISPYTLIRILRESVSLSTNCRMKPDRGGVPEFAARPGLPQDSLRQ